MFTDHCRAAGAAEICKMNDIVIYDIDFFCQTRCGIVFQFLFSIQVVPSQNFMNQSSTFQYIIPNVKP